MERRTENREGLEFARLHPAVNFIYIAAVLTVSMVTLNPWILGISFAASLLLGILYNGRKMLRRNLMAEVPVFIFTVLLQPMFSRSGATPLFYINENAVTREAYVYGVAVAVLLISVIQWCTCAHSLFTSDKFMYLFGRMIPTVGLILSMILRFIPLMRARYQQIHEGQAGLGRTASSMSAAARMRLYLKEISALISWSLEASIETAASMEARGYGMKGRTSYHLYRFRKSDVAAVMLLILLLMTVLSGVIWGGIEVYYLPQLHFSKNAGATAITAGAFILLAGFPLFYEMKGAIKWHCLNSKI